MINTNNTGKKNNFSFFIFHFLLLMLLSTLGQADFTRDNTTKIVTDSKTGLQWQDNERLRKSWQNAINYCETLTLGDNDDWRLPNINELVSIVDDTKENPSMTPVFKFFASTYYWSSTTYTADSDRAWYVYFGIGYQSDSPKSRRYSVRCVRLGE